MTFEELRESCRGALEESGVSLTEDSVRGLAVFRCVACGVPTERAEGLRKALLAANFMGGGARGARIAVTSEDEIVLTQVLPLVLLDGETATGLVRTLADAAKDWRELIADYGPAAVRQTAADEEALRLARRMAVSGFLRV